MSNERRSPSDSGDELARRIAAAHCARAVVEWCSPADRSSALAHLAHAMAQTRRGLGGHLPVRRLDEFLDLLGRPLRDWLDVEIGPLLIDGAPSMDCGDLLVTRFPILLIDESQDTSRRLMDVLLGIETAYRDIFCLALFGDTMQRIYADGKDRLAEAIPESWARPRKRMNHRCPTRVIELINKIRHDEDREEQVPRSDADAGVVRLFVVPQATTDKTTVEAAIAARMAEITGDQNWAAGSEAIKRLALEHLMAARRFGFEAFFKPLYSVERIRTSFLQGTGAGIGLFTREILPLVTALRASDRFAAAAIVRRTSPLLERKVLEDAGDNQADILSKAKAACDGLLALVSTDQQPSTQLLAPEFPFLDIDGTPRYIDFALRAAQRKIAFEVDGPTHYQPPDFDRNKYEDDLRRQTSLIHQGWQVYRWTDHELERQRERVKEQLALFLERLPGLLELDDFLPRQQGAAIDLRAHQQDVSEHFN